MTTLVGRPGLRVATLVAAALVAACGSQAAAIEPPAAPPAAIPEGWVTVSTMGGELQITLPPWLLVFDNNGAIFANEAPQPGENEIPIQLMAEPPGIDSDPGPGGDLVAWIDARLDDPGKGVPLVTRVSLPAGPAVRYERLDRAGTPTAWRILAFGIQSRTGAVFLVLDGLPNAWLAHAADIEQIPFLLGAH